MTLQLHPRAGTPLPVKLIALALAALATLVVLVPIMHGGVTAARLTNGAGVLLIAGAVVGLLLVEDRRARSVVLSEAGVSSLVWSVRAHFPFFWLSQVCIPWAAVDGVGTHGLLIGIRSGRRKILVNTYLFPDPHQVGVYISEHLSRTGGGGNAL